MAKRDPREERQGRQKHRSLLALVIVLFCILAGRLFTLQQIRHEHYSQYARQNRLQRERIVSPRGLIKDRNGVVLADNVPSFDIVIPWKTEELVRREVVRLSRYVPIDTEQVLARFDSWKKRHGRIPFPIVPDADKIVISFVRENYDLFPALRVETKARRRYPRGESGAHVLGYVGEVTDEFLAQARRGAYLAGDLAGRTGVESRCEEFLRGVDGQRVVAVNATGTVLGEVPEMLEPPVPGRDTHLTIDVRLQQLLEDLISEWRAGAAVVMDVHDGALLSAVSVPQFDPNLFTMGINQTEWNKLNSAEEKPLFNRFLHATYPPGSTFKIVSVYSALTRHLVDPNEALVYCTGRHRFGNRVFKCWKSWGHGYMDMYNGFVESCDSYFYELAEVVDVDQLAAAAREFGLGSTTGIDLASEAPGLVPDRAYYDRRYGKGKWTQGLVLNNIIGQGEFLASVLQMCRVAAAVANGGYLVQPYVVMEIEGERQTVHPRRRLKNVSPTALRYVYRAMSGVVHGEHGTARASRIAGLEAAGKTGTSQNPHGEDHAWFIGFAPADDPQIAVALIVENSGHGGAVAAPMARKLYEEYFKNVDSRLTQKSALPAAPGMGNSQ